MYKCPKCGAMPMQYFKNEYRCRNCGYVDPDETQRIRNARAAWLTEMAKIY